MNWGSESGRMVLGAGAVVTFALLLGMEVVKEPEIAAADLLTEALALGLVVGCSVCVALGSSRLQAQEAGNRDLRQEVARIRDRDSQWRADLAAHFRELGAAIQQQFEAWGCTPAEQDIGLLLLKGFSHKEIARLRDTSEATIRQQAASLYQKSELSGRAALSAYFLEELLDPGEGETSPIDRPPDTFNGAARSLNSLRRQI